MTTAVARRPRTTTASAKSAPKNRASGSTSTRSNGSAALARSTRPTSAPRRSTKPKLEVLDQRAIRSRARRRNALLAMFVVVLIGFFGVAFVHAELVTGQHELDVIRAEIAQTQADKARVERAVEEASAPEAIVARATEIGMVRATEPVYLAPSAPAPAVPTPVSFAPQAEEGVDAGPVEDGPESTVVVIAAPAPTSDAELNPGAVAASNESEPEEAANSDTADDVDVALPAQPSNSVVAAPVPAADPVGAPDAPQGIAGASVSTTASQSTQTGQSVSETERGDSRTIAGSRAVARGQGSG